MKLSNNVACLSIIAAAIIPIASATSCTSDVALPLTSDGGTDDYSADTGSNDSSTDAMLQAEGEINSLGLIGKRGTTELDCASGQTCFSYTDSLLLCLDATTGEL